MIKRALLLLLIPAICFSACNRHKQDWLIPDNKLVKILADIHISDAVVMSSEFYNLYDRKDTIQYYEDVLQKYGVSRADFDSTIHWYAGYPAKYDKLYEKVLIEISRSKDKLDAMDSTLARPNNFVNTLWNKKKDWILPDDGNKESITFDIPVVGKGKYTIYASIRLNTSDQSLNPRLTAYFWKEDGSPEGVRDTFTSLPILKNGILKQYTITKQLTDSTFTNLRGSILHHDSQSGRWKKNGEVKNIRLVYQKDSPIRPK
jgi:hypothetical protein